MSSLSWFPKQQKIPFQSPARLSSIQNNDAQQQAPILRKNRTVEKNSCNITVQSHLQSSSDWIKPELPTAPRHNRSVSGSGPLSTRWTCGREPFGNELFMSVHITANHGREEKSRHGRHSVKLNHRDHNNCNCLRKSASPFPNAAISVLLEGRNKTRIERKLNPLVMYHRHPSSCARFHALGSDFGTRNWLSAVWTFETGWLTGGRCVLNRGRKKQIRPHKSN